MNDDSVRLLCQCFVPLHSVSKNTNPFIYCLIRWKPQHGVHGAIAKNTGARDMIEILGRNRFRVDSLILWCEPQD